MDYGFIDAGQIKTECKISHFIFEINMMAIYIDIISVSQETFCRARTYSSCVFFFVYVRKFMHLGVQLIVTFNIDGLIR